MKYSLLMLLIPFTLLAQTPAAEQKMIQGYPTADMASSTKDQVDKQAAIDAYKLWYPTVSQAAMMKELNDKDIKENTTLAYLNADPKGKIFTPNQDTPYGLARFNLKDGPMVIEMPAGPYLGVVTDI